MFSVDLVLVVLFLYYGHMRWALRFLTKDGKEKQATLRRLATSSAKLYLLSMEMMAQVTLTNDPGMWQEKLRTTKTAQPGGVKRWLAEDAGKNRRQRCRGTWGFPSSRSPTSTKLPSSSGHQQHIY